MAIAPMSGITDEAFRRMFLHYGRPAVFWTEFVPVNALVSKGKDIFLRNLKFQKAEHPIVAQIFGKDPVLFEKAAIIIKNLGFDGIDINMGCPDRDVEKQGAGAALIRKPALAKEIIRAVKKGAGALPVSVKTRLGYAQDEINTWLALLLKEDLAALTVHFRTRNGKYQIPADWQLAQKIVKLRNRLAPQTLIFGNGDVRSLKEARALARKTGLDGIMIGRATVGNPWFFSEHVPNQKERLSAIIEHAEIFERLYKKNLSGKPGRFKNFHNIKKYFKGYATGFAGAKTLRDRLMQVKSIAEVRKLVKNFK